MTETINIYKTGDIAASQCLVTLEAFIGDMDNAELADDSTVDVSEAVTAINGLICALDQRDAEIERLRAENTMLRGAMMTIRTAVNAIEQFARDNEQIAPDRENGT